MIKIIIFLVVFVAIIVGAIVTPGTLPFSFLCVSFILFIIYLPRHASDTMTYPGKPFRKNEFPSLFRDAFIVLASFVIPALFFKLIGMQDLVLNMFDWNSSAWTSVLGFVFHAALPIAIEYTVRILPMLQWEFAPKKPKTYLFICCASAASAALSGNAWVIWIVPSVLLSYFAVIHHSPKRQILLRTVVQLGLLVLVAPFVRHDGQWFDMNTVSWTLIFASIICVAGSVYLTRNPGTQVKSAPETDLKPYVD